VAALGYLEKLRHWNDVSGGLLSDAVDAAIQALGWTVGVFSGGQVQQPWTHDARSHAYAATGFGFGTPC
jgi:hypothetical protein